MPFAGFKDFATCVAANQDKENPEAYCAAIQKQAEHSHYTSPVDEALKKLVSITGKHPYNLRQSDLEWAIRSGQITRDEAKLVSIELNVPFGYEPPMDSRQNIQNSEYAELRGVSVFTIGTHTDSAGNQRSYSHKDLEYMLRAFNEKRLSSVPIKLGHTSDEFNHSMAEALGIPSALLHGEGPGAKGALRLGEVTNLHLSQEGNLTADVRLANEKVASLIRDGYFTAVSPELRLHDDGPILGALSLLGAQRPALVFNHNALVNASLLDDGKIADAIYEFSSNFEDVRRDVYRDRSTGAQATAAARSESGWQPGKTESVWEVPVENQDTKRVSVIYHRAPAAETALTEVIHALSSGLREFSVTFGRGAGTVLATVLGTRLLIGRPRLLKTVIPGAKSDSQISMVEKVKRMIFEEFSGMEMSQLLTEFFSEYPEANISKRWTFFALHPDTAMNRVTYIWDRYQKGQIELDDAIAQIEKVVSQTKSLVTPEAFDRLQLAVKAIKFGITGRRRPEAGLNLEEGDYAGFTREGIITALAIHPGMSVADATALYNAVATRLGTSDPEKILNEMEGMDPNQLMVGEALSSLLSSIWGSILRTIAAIRQKLPFEEMVSIHQINYESYAVRVRRKSDGRGIHVWLNADSESEARSKALSQAQSRLGGSLEVEEISKASSIAGNIAKAIGGAAVSAGLALATRGRIRAGRREVYRAGSSRRKEGHEGALASLYRPFESNLEEVAELIGLSENDTVLFADQEAEEDFMEIIHSYQKTNYDEACVKSKVAEGMSEEEAKKACYKGSESAMDERVLDILGFTEGATVEQVVAKIQELQNDAAPKFSESEFASLKRQVRISHYMEETQNLAVSGTPKELAEKLVNYEEKGGEGLAKLILTEWQGLTTKAKESGLYEARLSPREGGGSTAFLEEVTKYQEKHPDLTRAESVKAVMKQNPSLYHEYAEETKGS